MITVNDSEYEEGGINAPSVMAAHHHFVMGLKLQVKEMMDDLFVLTCMVKPGSPYESITWGISSAMPKQSIDQFVNTLIPELRLKMNAQLQGHEVFNRVFLDTGSQNTLHQLHARIPTATLTANIPYLLLVSGHPLKGLETDSDYSDLPAAMFYGNWMEWAILVRDANMRLIFEIKEK